MDHNLKFGREALVASVSFCILLALASDPTVALIVLWLVPFPIIVFQAIGQKYVSIGLACVIAVFLFLLGFGLTAVLCAFGIYFIGWVMGESIRNADSPYMPLITGSLVIIMLILVLLALVYMSGFDILSAIMQEIDLGMKGEQSIFGMDARSAAQLAADFKQSVHMMFPAILCIMAFLIAAVNLLLARVAVQSKTMVLRPLLLTWRLPSSAITIYVVSLVIVLFGWGKDQGLWWQMANNILLLTGFFLGIQGIAFLWRLVQGFAGRKILLILLFVLAGVQIVGSVYVLLGLFDAINYSRRAQ